jgi:NAD(P)-dependent dehydrogenase (short-subunit alcohol dehydrogenase family)
MKGIDTCSYEEFQYALSVGVTAPFYLAKLFRPFFAQGAAIVNICIDGGMTRQMIYHGDNGWSLELD